MRPGTATESSGAPPTPPSGEHGGDRYAVRKQIAAGGMGVVYHVYDRITGEERAQKRIRRRGNEPLRDVEAFEREYQVLAGLDHPRIIRVYDYGVDAVGPYYTMELLEGEDMRHAAPLPYRQVCGYLRDVATSLALLHARRLVHRDLSPSNVRRTPDGHCKLLDFGALAPFGRVDTIVGTAPAIPPEALEGGPLDQRADLYSLGALAYWMLTGRHAYPAQLVQDLRRVWEELPLPPSSIARDVPPELDTLVMSLLSHEPLARPASAAEVIARLQVIGELPPEGADESERLALSFLANPRFTGRTLELAVLEQATAEAAKGRGSALRIESVAGMGRTRLLEEVAVRAQLSGATVLRVDAGMYQKGLGLARALAIRLLDAMPEVARRSAAAYRPALAALGPDVISRVRGGSTTAPIPTPSSVLDLTSTLDAWFVDTTAVKPLVILVDDVDEADDASLALLVALARRCVDHRLLLVVAERIRREPRESAGLLQLRHLSRTLSLPGLSLRETLDLARSLFGDAPNVDRFAEWLHGRTAGSPLHVVEVSRQLLSRNVIRYVGGLFLLPFDRPDAELPAALEDALLTRLASLGTEARSLAECLSLQREEPTLALCRQLSEGTDERTVVAWLDELGRHDVLYPEEDGYRFASRAIRDALLAGMDDERREANHRRLGEAFARLATEDPVMRIEAGFHLIAGGEDVRGADLIASVTHRSLIVRRMIANLHLAGRPIEAALEVYKRHRRSIYERMPLLAVLAQAGYYEDRKWADRYGDEALDVLDDISGLDRARRWARFVGRFVGLVIGMGTSLLRWWLTPRKQRPYSYYEMLVQLFGTITTMTGTASLVLDADRARRVADMLEPYSVLPERVTAVAMYRFSRSVQEIGRDHQATAYHYIKRLSERLSRRTYYLALPEDARLLIGAGANFARGVFATFRADSGPALECADILDASGFKLYSMIASQLRVLYYMNRGEVAKAAEHREQVDVHAAQVGSAWQVELWEAPASIPIACMLGDVVAMTRIHDRLQVASRTVPSLRLYHRLATVALSIVKNEPIEALTGILERDVLAREPRSFIGWAMAQGIVAMRLNTSGRHAEAKAVAERVLAEMTDADRDFPVLYLSVDVEMAHAEAALGNVPGALARIDALLARYAPSEHPLVLGSLHEARARIAAVAGLGAIYEESLAGMERHYRSTGTPALVARCERIAELAYGPGVAANGRALVSDETTTAPRRRRPSQPPPPAPDGDDQAPTQVLEPRRAAKREGPGS
ncbi:MAG: protein kinase [Polyangiales bacterium]